MTDRDVPTAAVLAARCRRTLEEHAAHGGPTVEEHLDDLRRMLARRPVAEAAVRAARVAAALRGELDTGVSPRLVRDLRRAERALTASSRVGVPRSRASCPS